MRKRRNSKKATLLAVAIIAAAGIAGSAFAASISGSSGNAGQGVSVTDGYTAGVITYTGGWTNTNTNETSDLVTQVQFILARSGDAGTSTVTSSNTDVYVQLMTSSGGFGNWTTCSVGTSPAAGTVTCNFSGSQQRALSLVNGVNIVANSK